MIDLIIRLHWSKVESLNNFLLSNSTGIGTYMWFLKLNNKYYPYYVGTATKQSILDRVKDETKKMKRNIGNIIRVEDIVEEDLNLYSCINDFSIDYLYRKKNNIKQENKFIICNGVYKNKELETFNILQLAENNIKHSFISYVDISNIEAFKFSERINKFIELKYFSELIEGILIKYLKNKFGILFYENGNTLLGHIEHSELKQPTNICFKNIISYDDKKYFEMIEDDFKDIYNYR